MTTPTPQSRRSFLTTLAGLVLAPVIAARALAAAKAAPTLDITTIPLKSEVTYARSRSILVPSNRTPFQAYRNADGSITWGYLYKEGWDGTMKLDAGCTNPAWVLCDLQGLNPTLAHVSVYHWAMACDELVLAPITPRDRSVDWHSPDGHGEPVSWRPRHTIHTLYVAENDLRRSLETHFEVWKATDERYRKSWPGIPYPGDVS